jgi:hypothetical protein
MKTKERHQLKFRVHPTDARRLKVYCAAKDITETALLDAALKQFLAGTSIQDVVIRRLDRISLELARTDTSLELLGEAFATFVQLWLAHNPEIDERDKAAAQRDVARRYRRFTTHIVRTIRDGRSTLLHQLLGTRAPIAEAEELDRARFDETVTITASTATGVSS